MERTRREVALLAAVAVGWLVVARMIAKYGATWLPRSLASQLTLHSYSSLVLLAATAIGLGASFALLRQPYAALGLGRAPADVSARGGVSPPTPVSAVAGLLWAPIVVATSSYLGFKLALPTLLEEIKRGGAQAAQANTGAYGRAIAESHVLTTLVWAVLLTPIAEELIFRGALWSAITKLTAAPSSAPRSLPSELLSEGAAGGALGKSVRWLRDGGIATFVTAGIFAWMHADQAGGAGIVRIAQSACLGVALGVTRHHSRSLWPAMLLHAGFNLVSLAKLRKWLVGEGWPPPLPIPLWQWQLALACAVLMLLWWLHRSERLRRVEVRAGIYVARPRAQVFDVVIQPATIVASFKGHGPIPGATKAEMVDGAMEQGALRRVTNSDGSVIDERIVLLEPPARQGYELVSGFRFPFTLLVRGAGGAWQLDEEGDGTQIDWRFRFDLTSAFAFPFAKLLGRPFGIAMRQALERIRSLCEEGPRDG